MDEKMIRILSEAALEVRSRAYAPYSGFCVGAALLCAGGRIYTGVNVENASYPVGLCAERGAFASAVAAGEREFIAIAITGGKAGQDPERCMPCGMCRQFMAELCGDEFEVLTVYSPERYESITLGNLLPECFRLK